MRVCEWVGSLEEGTFGWGFVDKQEFQSSRRAQQPGASTEQTPDNVSEQMEGTWTQRTVGHRAHICKV